MSHRALAEKLIANFGTLLTLPELKLDDVSNSCVLLFDGETFTTDEWKDRVISIIGRADTTDDIPILDTVVLANDATNMTCDVNFDDTPEEAAYRAQVRSYIETHRDEPPTPVPIPRVTTSRRFTRRLLAT